MIPLFNIPNYTIETSQFSNLLHDQVVRKFEDKFCEYVGAKYACSLNSASSAIFLIFKELITDDDIWDDLSNDPIKIPSIIPPVVPNQLQNAFKERYNPNFTPWKFCDNITWPGHAYVMHDFGSFKVIDSAQEVSRDQFRTTANNNDLMIYSFFPTKPVGSCDGGIVVSNDREKIERLRLLANDGFSNVFKESWNRKHEITGYKMYMNSISAFIALKNLERLDIKKTRLQDIRNQYNERFGIKNTSDHLYRISVSNNRRFIKQAEQAEQARLTCGIHYDAQHLNSVYKPIDIEPLPLSVKVSNTTVSIPFNEALNKKEVDAVINFVLHEFENEHY